jgi:hypothetical protein
MKKIVVGLATIPERESTLPTVLASLHDQVDLIEVALNGYTKKPTFAKLYPKARFHLTTNDKGDANKFLTVEKHRDAYYFSCDDDIKYPVSYIQTMIKYIEKHQCLVTCHGSDIPDRRLSSYYKNKVMRSHCLHTASEVSVDVAGSGVSGFDTSVLRLSYDRFELPNMADIFMSIQCVEQSVKRIAIKHRSGWIKGGMNKGRATIYETHRNNDRPQTKIVNEFDWRK